MTDGTLSRYERWHRLAAALLPLVLSAPSLLPLFCDGSGFGWGGGTRIPPGARSAPAGDAADGPGGGVPGSAEGEATRTDQAGEADGATEANTARSSDIRGGGSKRARIELSVRLIGERRNRNGEIGPDVRIAIDARGDDEPREILWRTTAGGPWRKYRSALRAGTLWKRGGRQIEFAAVAEHGGRSPVFRYELQVDDVAPELPLLRFSRPPTGGATGTFVGREGIFIPPFEAGAVLEYRLDDGEFVRCQVGQTVRPPPDGVFAITFRISDEVGNSRSRTLRIKSDSTPPRSSIRFE